MRQRLDCITVGQVEVDFASSSIGSTRGSFSIEPKVMDVLQALVENAGDVVERASLIDRVWGHSCGTDERLSRAISLLRKACGDTKGDCNHIETIPKRGYRLIAQVKEPSRADKSQPLADLTTNDNRELSIAVLPFVDMSAEQNQEFLADGVAEEIINVLAQVSELKVTGRTSSFSFKAREENITQIAKELDVTYILEGSLRKFGDRLRVTAQLIQASDGFHLFSKTYEGHVVDVFDLQDRIAYAIVNELYGVFDLTGSERSQKAFTKNASAYEFFLRGRQLVHRLNGQTTIPTGIKFLTKATEHDPDYALAWAWLGLAHFVLPEFSRTRAWAEHIQLSRQAIDKALTIDPKSSIALLVQAMLFAYDGKFDQALRMHKRALERDPNNIETLAGMGLGLMAIGLHKKAKPYLERVIAQDPLCGIWHTTYGGLLLAEGNFRKAEACFKRSFNLGFGAAAFGVSHRMACSGNSDEAVKFMKENFDGLGPIEHAELKSPLVRNLVLNAYLRRGFIAKKLVGMTLRSRLRNPSAQPTAASVIGFLFLNRPGDFMRSVLEKPNPYIGYTVARIWEPTQESVNIRAHKNFHQFAERMGFINAWQEYGWPTQLVPLQTANLTKHSFSVIA